MLQETTRLCIHNFNYSTNLIPHIMHTIPANFYKLLKKHHKSTWLNHLRFFSSSNLRVRSSKSTSSFVTEFRPTLFVGTLGKPGTSGSTGKSGIVWFGAANEPGTGERDWGTGRSDNQKHIWLQGNSIVGQLSYANCRKYSQKRMVRRP